MEHFYSTYFKAGKVSIDSRKIGEGDVFFAFSGEQFNAAMVAEKAIEQGASAVIVEDGNYANPEKNIFLVPSTLGFLQQLALHHRKQLNIPIIALTAYAFETDKELALEMGCNDFVTKPVSERTLRKALDKYSTIV